MGTAKSLELVLAPLRPREDGLQAGEVRRFAAEASLQGGDATVHRLDLVEVRELREVLVERRQVREEPGVRGPEVLGLLLTHFSHTVPRVGDLEAHEPALELGEVLERRTQERVRRAAASGADRDVAELALPLGGDDPVHDALDVARRAGEDENVLEAELPRVIGLLELLLREDPHAAIADANRIGLEGSRRSLDEDRKARLGIPAAATLAPPRPPPTRSARRRAARDETSHGACRRFP